MIEASHAIRRTVSGARRSPVSVVPAPVRSARSVQSIVTTTAAFGVVGASPPAAAARRQTSTRASARRWSLVRMSDPCTVEGCGAANGPRIASSTAWPSGSSRNRYSAIPSSGYGWDSDRPDLSWSSRRWNSPNRPYLAMTCGRSARICAGPSDPRSPRTRPAPSPHTQGSTAAPACPSRPTRPRRYGPGPARPGPPRPAARCGAGRPPRPPLPTQPHHRRGRRAPTGAPIPPATPHPKPARPPGQRLVQHGHLSAPSHRLELIHLAEQRPQLGPTRPGAPGPPAAAPPARSRQRRPVLPKTGPLHDTNVAATTDSPTVANTAFPQRLSAYARRAGPRLGARAGPRPPCHGHRRLGDPARSTEGAARPAGGAERLTVQVLANGDDEGVTARRPDGGGDTDDRPAALRGGAHVWLTRVECVRWVQGDPARPGPATAMSAGGQAWKRPRMSSAVSGARTARRVDHPREEIALALLQRDDLLLDGARRDQPVDDDRAGLPDAVRAVDGLGLGGGVPPRVEEEDVVGLGEVEPEAAGLEADEEDRRRRRRGTRRSARAGRGSARRGRRRDARARRGARAPCRGTPVNWLKTSARWPSATSSRSCSTSASILRRGALPA